MFSIVYIIIIRCRNIIINSKGKIVHLTRLFDKEEFDTMKTVISELIDEL